MSFSAEILDVWIDRFDTGPIFVGRLNRDTIGNVQFVVDKGFIERGTDRPILSIGWMSYIGSDDQSSKRLSDPNDKAGLRGMLPPFFSNLLPEGALRELVEKQLGTGRHTEFDVIKHLGGDLPGAIKVLPVGSDPVQSSQSLYSDFPIHSTSRITASLPGMQMKFSGLIDKRFSMPAERGDLEGSMVAVIAKPAAKQLNGLPENEFTCMKLAEMAGVRIANVALLPSDLISGVSSKYFLDDQPVLVVDRFDRNAHGRVHMEEFAQSVGALGNQKYTMGNGETILRMVDRFAGRIFLKEAVTRTVVNLLLGNGDAHLKNWAYLFTAPAQATLSPAYDIVSTAVYDANDKMAQKFGGSVNPEHIGIRKFLQAAVYLRVTEKDMHRWVQETVEKAYDLWPAAIHDLPMIDEHKDALKKHWGRLRLTSDLSFVPFPATAFVAHP